LQNSIGQTINRDKINATTVSYEDGLKASLSNPLEVAAYLNAALEEGSQEALLLALRDVDESKEIFIRHK
jgi:DNA-binding phage protein